MEANQKLQQFMDAVSRSTDAEIARAEREAEQKAKQYLLDAEARCKADYERTLAAAESRISAIISLFLSLFSYLITCIEKVVVCSQ